MGGGGDAVLLRVSLRAAPDYARPFSVTGGRMKVSLRRLAALGLVGALGLAAAPVKKIQFTDTKLKNGLRVIISEDHSAPVFAVAVNYNVGSRDERKGRTGFAHLFEHMMFKGSANVGAGRASAPRLRQRRLDERHDQQGSDALLRDPAGQPARPRAVPRGRPHALARHHQGQPRQPAQRRAGRAAARRRQPAVRPHVRGPRRAGVTTTSPTSTRSSARWPI